LWLFRGAAAWGRSMEFKYLKGPSLRRAVKALVDFACGSLSVLVAIALDRGIASFGVSETARLALAVGGFLVAAEALVGSYRTMWRYAGFQEAVVITTCSLILLTVLLAGRWTGLVALSMSTVLLIVLLTLFSCVGMRALRRWQVAEAKRRAIQRRVARPMPSARRLAQSDTDRRRGGAWALHQPGARPVAAPGGGAHRLCRR